MNRFKVLVCALALNLIWAFPLQLQAEDWTSFYAGMTSSANFGMSIARRLGGFGESGATLGD